MKQNLVVEVHPRACFVRDVVEVPVHAKLMFVHPVYRIYVDTRNVFSVAGRAEEIRHAALLAVQARGEHAGDVRFYGVRKPRKRKTETSSRQLPLWPLDGFEGGNDDYR